MNISGRFLLRTVCSENTHTTPTILLFLRFTRAKPVVPYSVNFGAIKEIFLSRKAILDALPKDVVASIEKLYSNSMK